MGDVNLHPVPVMRSLHRLFLGSSLAVALLASSASLQAAPSSSAEQWLNDYYKNPAPQQFSGAIQELSDSGYFEQPGHVPLAIGFIASVFAQNPNRVNEWMDMSSTLPEAHQRLMAAALWYSGNPRGADYIRAASRESRPGLRQELRSAIASNAELRAAQVRSSSSMNLQWGVFLATGDKAPVQNILAALGSGSQSELGQNVRWSLAQNAAQHPRVIAICRDELSRQPNAAKETLRAVILESEGQRQPRS
jgi:hypothetical protein